MVNFSPLLITAKQNQTFLVNDTFDVTHFKMMSGFREQLSINIKTFLLVRMCSFNKIMKTKAQKVMAVPAKHWNILNSHLCSTSAALPQYLALHTHQFLCYADYSKPNHNVFLNTMIMFHKSTHTV